MLSKKFYYTLARLLSIAAVLALLLDMPGPVLASGRTGNVYVLTNQSTGNAVLIYHRDAAGRLRFVDSVASGGIGFGTGPDPLASQGAVILSKEKRLLFAVNAGSDSVSVFAVSDDHLVLLDTISSGGILPVSLAVQDNLLYVLNAGGTPNISGFTIDPSTNELVAIPGSTQNLPGGVAAAPGQISFSPDGELIIVTEKGTNLIDTFVIDENGAAQAGAPFSSGGATPFGFAFGHDDVLVVSDAGSGPGTAAASSYAVNENGNVDMITPKLNNGQTAACWVVIPQNGRFAYVSNGGSGTISSYGIAEDGSLALLDPAAGSTGNGSTPTDMALTNNSRFLYVRTGGNGTISVFRIGAHGKLMPVSTIGGLPNGTQGIAAR